MSDINNCRFLKTKFGYDIKPKVPRGWTAHWSKIKKTYYFHNEHTGENTWEFPIQAAIRHAVPKGWLPVWDENRQEYYYLEIDTDFCLWTKPPLVPNGWCVKWSAKRNMFYFVNQFTNAVVCTEPTEEAVEPTEEIAVRLPRSGRSSDFSSSRHIPKPEEVVAKDDEASGYLGNVSMAFAFGAGFAGMALGGDSNMQKDT